MTHWRALAVALLAFGLALYGIDARDLTGDEVAIFTGSPWETWVLALGLDEHFTGHMPLSYWLRWPVLALFGEDTVWAWRLHAAVGFAVAAGLTASSRLRWGAWAGLGVALSPVASFHGMESANYAWTLALGALVVVALEAPVQRWRWWVAGLVMAALNDLYAVWLGAGAVAALAVVHRDDRAALRRPLVVLGVLTAPLVVWMLIRMGVGGEAATIGMHADAAGADTSLGSLWLRRLQRFGGANLMGYAFGRESATWEQGPSVLLPLLAVALAARARSPAARSAAWVALGGLGAALLASATVWLAFERVLPTEPRVLIGLVPALLLCVVAAAEAMGRWAMPWLVGAGLPAVAGTAAQVLSLSTLHTDAAAYVEARAGGADVVIAPERIRGRMNADRRSSAAECIEAMPAGGQRVWWVVAQPIEHTLEWRGCLDARGVQPVVDVTGWRLASVWTAGPPEHERSAAGFVRPVAVFEWVPRSDEPALSEVVVGLERAPLDGLSAATIETARLGGQGEWWSLGWFDLDEGEAPVVSTAQPSMSRVQVRARAKHGSWLPEWSLLDPYRRDVQAWELMIVDPQIMRASWQLPARPLQHPAWSVLRRLILVACTLGAVASLCRRRMR